MKIYVLIFTIFVVTQANAQFQSGFTRGLQKWISVADGGKCEALGINGSSVMQNKIGLVVGQSGAGAGFSNGLPIAFIGLMNALGGASEIRDKLEKYCHSKVDIASDVSDDCFIAMEAVFGPALRKLAKQNGCEIDPLDFKEYLANKCSTKSLSIRTVNIQNFKACTLTADCAEGAITSKSTYEFKCRVTEDTCDQIKSLKDCKMMQNILKKGFIKDTKIELPLSVEDAGAQ